MQLGDLAAMNNIVLHIYQALISVPQIFASVILVAMTMMTMKSNKLLRRYEVKMRPSILFKVRRFECYIESAGSVS